MNKWQEIKTNSTPLEFTVILLITRMYRVMSPTWQHRRLLPPTDTAKTLRRGSAPSREMQNGLYTEWLVHIGWLRNHPTSEWLGNSGTPAHHEPHPQHSASQPQWNPQCLASLSRIWTSYQHAKFLKLIEFNWRLITLQYCGGFLYALTWISHGCTCVPHPEPLSPQGCPSAPALSALFHASNLDWWSISHIVIHMFQCYSLKSSRPHLLPQNPKVCSLYLCLFCCLAYRVIITIFLNSIYMC